MPDPTALPLSPLPGSSIILRVLIDALAVALLARGIYYPLHRQKDYLFTFVLFNALIFSLCLLLSTATMQIGFAFGLFAVFSIIRYRTVTIPVKEMGYFFAAVSMAMINALASDAHFFGILFGADALILLLVLLLDKYASLTAELTQEILYERIELIAPEKRADLLQDLRIRTGLNIHRVEIGGIDLVRDTVALRAFYYD